MASIEVSGTAAHARAVDAVRERMAALEPGRRVRLAKATSNLFRTRTTAGGSDGPYLLDVSDFADVVSIDPQARTAVVGGMTTYERLVEVTLAHGLMPLVVPQLRTITLGGAVTGLGIESSSFRAGLPHESVISMEVLTGTGEVVHADPDGPDAVLFHGFPNSYGSLGYALSLTIELAPVEPFVALRHVRLHSPDELVSAVDDIMSTGEADGTRVDFLDGVVFSRDELYLTLGTFVGRLDAAVRPSDYSGSEIYYRSIQAKERDVLTVADYLWRWDTDWFWCSRAFGAQHPLVRRLWPRSKLRSDVYWKLIGLDARYDISRRVDAARGRPAREKVVQDVEIPLVRTASFLDWFLAQVPIEPIWLCPIQLRPGLYPQGTTPWPLYPMSVGERYVNVGFWSSVPVAEGARPGETNREIERVVGEHGGHKSLYSEAFYSRDDFERLYGGGAGAELKQRYDPAGRFPGLYEKAVQGR